MEFNLGLTFSYAANISLTVYYNAYEVYTYLLNTSLDELPDPTPSMFLLHIGSNMTNETAVGVRMCDLAIWYRTLLSFERHMFLGYTSKLCTKW